MWLCAAAGPPDRETLCDIVKLAVNIDVFHCISRMCAEHNMNIYVIEIHKMSQCKTKKNIKNLSNQEPFTNLASNMLQHASTINTFSATKCSVTPGPWPLQNSSLYNILLYRANNCPDFVKEKLGGFELHMFWNILPPLRIAEMLKPYIPICYASWTSAHNPFFLMNT